MPLKPFFYAAVAYALLMHYAKRPSKQSTVNTPTGVMDTQTNHGTAHSYETGRIAPKFAAGYEG
jgi:hypothetical protein